ncbi:MAG: caspase family protein, partial [Candidatus Binataceae bacterium]
MARTGAERNLNRHYRAARLAGLIAALAVICTALTLFADQPPANPVIKEKGTLWVFAVGVSKYRNPMIDLQFADNDAKVLAATLKERGAGVYQDVKTDVLLNDQATRQSIIDGINQFFAPAAAGDTAVIALMGHGVSSNGTFYFVPYPADLSNLTTAGLPVKEFETAVRKVGSWVARTVLVVDTCHAADLNFQVRGLSQLQSRTRKARGISLVSAIAPKLPEAYILSSSEGSENSWEDSKYRLPGETEGHGAFTYALLQGLDGAAAHNGVVNVLDLFAYASDQVPLITGGKQHPYVRGQGINFPIAEVRSVSPEDAVAAAALVQKGVRLQNKGQLGQAQTVLARAGELNPRDQVSRVLHDEVSADIKYRQDPQAQQDIIEETAALLKGKYNRGPSDPWTPRPMIIAFLDFSTAGNSPQLAGLHEALVARIQQALAGTKRVQVVDRRLLDQVLQELRLSMSDLSDPATRLRVGKILVARLIATGNLVFLGKQNYLANVQLIDTETTAVAVNLSQPGSGPDQILTVADKAAAGILQQLQQAYPLRGKVIALDGDDAILDMGSKDGATLGTTLNAVVEESIKVNGEVVAHRMKPVGSM